MIDQDRLVDDLIALRESTGKSQREFGKASGLGYGKVQQIEARKRRIWFDDLDKWLRACGSSLALYVRQFLTEEERKILDKDKDAYRRFRKAMKIMRKRQMLTLYLDGLVPDEE